MKKLYKFFWDCGRQGEVEGLFIADEKEVQKSIGQKVYFGDILGKYSDIYGTIEEGEITEIEVSETTIREMEEVLGTNISGYNPLNYIQYKCSRCGDSLTVGEINWYIDKDKKKICEYCATEEEKTKLTQL